MVSVLLSTSFSNLERRREARRAVRRAISAALQSKLARRELNEITQHAAAGRLSALESASLLQRELAAHLRRKRRAGSTHSAGKPE